MPSATIAAGTQAIAQLWNSVDSTTLISLMQVKCVARVGVAQRLKSAYHYQRRLARILTMMQLTLMGMDATGIILRKKQPSVAHSIQMNSMLMRCAVAVVVVIIHFKECNLSQIFLIRTLK